MQVSQVPLCNWHEILSREYTLKKFTFAQTNQMQKQLWEGIQGHATTYFLKRNGIFTSCIAEGIEKLSEIACGMPLKVSVHFSSTKQSLEHL